MTDEFIGHIRAEQAKGGWDLSQTTEFLLVAATLLDLKAARLLPHSGPEDEEDLALIDHAGGGRIRGYRTVQSDIVELDLHVGSDLAAPSAPRGYQKIVLDLYRSETVTDDRAIALLHGGFTEADLPDRDPLPEDAIRSLL